MKNIGNQMICKMYINNLNYQMCKKNKFIFLFHFVSICL